MNSIVKQDLAELINGWLEQENNGVQFPVPFDIAWRIAGYTRKSVAKRRLVELEKGTDYCTEKCKTLQGGRSSDLFHMTCDALKHFGLMAKTEEGRQIRQHFIEAEKKWRIVEKVNPEFAQQIELMQLQADIAKASASMLENQRYIMDKSEAIISLHGVQMLALIQGRPDAVVEKIEKVTETVICRNGRNVSFEGKSTAELGKELGFKTGKELERWLAQNKRQDLICEGLRAVQAPYIPTEFIAEVKKLWSQTRKAKGTQLILGE